MITKNDLVKIKNVVEEVFDKKFDAEIKPINKEIKTINKRLNKIQKDLTTTINYFDHNVISHENRIRTIENHLNFPQTV